MRQVRIRYVLSLHNGLYMGLHLVQYICIIVNALTETHNETKRMVITT